MKVSIERRLKTVETETMRQAPEKIFVKLKDGTVETTDAGGVWTYFTDETKRKQVDEIWTETPGYEEVCGVVENLCKS